MKVRLFKISGYEEAIMSLRMSKGKFYSWDKAVEIQQLVYICINEFGMICTESEYDRKIEALPMSVLGANNKITGDYEWDVNEFKRLLTLTFDNAMHKHNHHTLMKYIDLSFFTEGLHRGAQDDLDAHAIAFNNRITRFSTRLAEIEDNKLSEWYQDKIIPLHDAIDMINRHADTVIGSPYSNIDLPQTIEIEGEGFKYTPFGYVVDKFAQVPAKNGLAKDVQRGGMTLGLASDAIWKIDIANLRYVYKMRSKLTKANPELKDAMEDLADQVEKSVPVFGEYFRKQFTDSGKWEHMNKVKTIASDEYDQFKKWKRENR